jgi:hypothetical protein
VADPWVHPNPWVHPIGTVGDIDGRTLTVGVDYDSVTIGGYRLEIEVLDRLVDLIMRAAREAARCEASGD